MRRLLLVLLGCALIVACGSSSGLRPAISFHGAGRLGARYGSESAPTVGEVLSTSNGTWSNSPTSFVYQWQRCATTCTNIPGATSNTYTVQTADVGDTIDVTVTASNAGGSASQTSAQTGVVTGSTGGGQLLMAYDLAWTHPGSVSGVTNQPSGMTQDNLFTVTPCDNSGSADCPTVSSVDSNVNGISGINEANWIAAAHAHGAQAFIDWGGSGAGQFNFGYACTTAAAAATAQNIVNYAVSNGFDGLEIDDEEAVGGRTPGGQPQLTEAGAVACFSDIAADAAAATTAQGKALVVTGYDCPGCGSTPDAEENPYVSWFDSGGYQSSGGPGAPTWTSGGNGYINKVVNGPVHIPASRVVPGLDMSDSGAQTVNGVLGTTNANFTEPGTTTLTLNAALTKAIAAGNVVIGTTENPPAHWQVLTTSGAAVGATSIPITASTSNNGVVSNNGSFTYPAGSDIYNYYQGEFDCGYMAKWALQNGFKGSMVYGLTQDPADFGGQYACLQQMALNDH